MALVKNGMSRALIIQRPNKGLIVLSEKGRADASVIIPPLGQAEVPFWDEVKNHPIYQNLLDRHKIAVDNDTPSGEPDFTSMGDTLVAPAKLDPETVKEEANSKREKMEYMREPVATTRRRSRKISSESAVL